MSQGEYQVGELMLLEFDDKLLVLLVGELAGIVLYSIVIYSIVGIVLYSFCSFATGRVEKHYCGDIISVWFGDAGYLLGQDPHGNSVVPGAEAKIDKLPRAALNIFRRGAVIKYEQGVGPREEEDSHLQPVLDLVLQAHDHIDVRVAVHETLVGLVLDKCGAEEHNVVKPALKGPRSWFRRYCVLPELVGPTIRALKGSFLWSIRLILRCLCLKPWLVCWWGGRLSEQSLYFIKRFYPWVCGWCGFRVEVDLVCFSHVVY